MAALLERLQESGLGAGCAFPQSTDDLAMALRKRRPGIVQLLVNRVDLCLIFENDENFDAFAAAFPGDLAFQSGSKLPGLGDRDYAA